jgi:hypothetical protein
VDDVSQGSCSHGKSQFMRPPSRPNYPYRPTLAKRQFTRPLPHASRLYEPLEPLQPLRLPQAAPLPQAAAESVVPVPPKSPGLAQVASHVSAVKLRRLTRARCMHRLFSLCSIAAIAAVIFISLSNGAPGALAADLLRGLVGPTLIAQIESWYLGISDETHQVQFSLSGQHVTPPWAAASHAHEAAGDRAQPLSGGFANL